MKNNTISISNRELRQKIVEVLDLPKLTKPQQDKIVSLLMDSVFSRIGALLQKKLKEKDSSELKKVTTRGGKAFLNFINARVENFPELVETVARETVNDFRKKRAKR